MLALRRAARCSVRYSRYRVECVRTQIDRCFASQEKSIEATFVKKTHREHVLARPEPYMGSIAHEEMPSWVHVDGEMQLRTCSYVPALLQIFDEILVNAADNRKRNTRGQAPMTTIKVDIDKKLGEISVFNDGAAIQCVMHKTEKVYVPELIFGNLLTSSNFDDRVQRTVGGRHGYGAKLTNIFSKEFHVEIYDALNGVHYMQKFSSNLSVIHPPTITPRALPEGKEKSSWTKITFRPDLEKFKMNTLWEGDVELLMQRRVWDIAAAVCVEGVSVYLNKKKCNIKSFQQYCALFPCKKIVYEEFSDCQWNIAVGLAQEMYFHVSFVNSVCTTRGGTHVTWIMDQVVAGVIEYCKKNYNLEVARKDITPRLCLFLQCTIPNPTFDSQNKEYLLTPIKNLSSPSPPVLSNAFLKKICVTTGIAQLLVELSESKKNAALMKATKKVTGKANKTLGIDFPKLEDAHFAGVKDKGYKCTLILTEGDSAKALAVAGLGVIGRQYYGVFPLRGKVLNVRGATNDKIINNSEITQLIRILGLQHGTDYTSLRARQGLRYGKVMIMADQDHDGSHIKALVMNVFHVFWPSLLRTNDFLEIFNTPIVKAKYKGETKSFFNIGSFQQWAAQQQHALRLWYIKYYKGLGTNTAEEAREYFKNLEKLRKKLTWKDEKCGDALDMVFNKKKSGARKTWVVACNRAEAVDTSPSTVSYYHFVNKELIQYSYASNVRAIPNLMDGFKPGQRKVIFACLKRNLVKKEQQIKVAQLSGYISEHTGYHHGEVSLHGTIVGLAQDFVGSNNVPLLVPSGQFGTRNKGGDDAASARYIHTYLQPVVRKLFRDSDDSLLTYVDEDGTPAEPLWYAPVIPMALVNGAEGIGTGFATKVPCFDPLDIIENVRRALRNQEMSPMSPWYKYFTGEVVPSKSQSVNTFGNYEVEEHDGYDEITISELPIGVWTSTYKETILARLGPDIQSLTEYHTDTTVKFVIQLQRSEMFDGDYVNLLSLVRPVSLNCMYFFDANGKMRRFFDPRSIISEFIPTRLDLYHKRKEALLAALKASIQTLGNQARFINAIITGELVLHKKTKPVLVHELEERGFDPADPKKQTKNTEDDADDDDDALSGPNTEKVTSNVSKTASGKDSSRYDYLLNMRFSSLTSEKMNRLNDHLTRLQAEFSALEKHTAATLWEQDLKDLEEFFLQDPAWANRVKKQHTPAQLELLNENYAKDLNGEGEDMAWDDSSVPDAEIEEYEGSKKTGKLASVGGKKSEKIEAVLASVSARLLGKDTKSSIAPDSTSRKTTPQLSTTDILARIRARSAAASTTLKPSASEVAEPNKIDVSSIFSRMAARRTAAGVKTS